MGWTLVTGGAKRLGAAICVELARCGYDVVVHYRHSQEEAQQVVEVCRRLGVRAEKIQGDLASPAQVDLFVDRYMQEFPLTKNIINNVGNYMIGSALQTNQDDWSGLFQTNLFAPIALSQKLLPSIREMKGSIVNIGTAGAALGIANTYSTAYQMTKSALLQWTKALAKELAPDQVRVNMVSPGHLEISVDLPSDPSKLPMGRAGTAAEAARVVAFLLEPTNGYITGQNIEVAGAVQL